MRFKINILALGLTHLKPVSGVELRKINEKPPTGNRGFCVTC